MADESALPARMLTADVLAAVAAAATEGAGGVDPELLGDFLPVVEAAVRANRKLTRSQLQRYRALGQEAARRGVPQRALLDLYLTAAWRLWPHLPEVTAAERDPGAVVAAGDVLLQALSHTVAALVEGYQLARRSLVRAQESARREFVDDLLSGHSDTAGLVARAYSFGLDLGGPHAVAVALAERPFTDGTPLAGTVERALAGTKADADSLVTTKDGLLVAVFAAPDRAAVAFVTDRLAAVLGPQPGQPETVVLYRRAGAGAWQVGVGRPRPGPLGVLASYREARDALELAGRLRLVTPVVDAADLLIYQVLLRDRDAVTDLVRALLTPLLAARGGAGPLLDTLAAYFEAGGNSAQTARALHLSVRAVTYRLDRIHQLTGYDPADATARFALQAAVLGARLLDWPANPLA